MKTYRTILFAIALLPAGASADTWRFDKVAETLRLTENRFYLNTSADLNGNGRKEVIVADFGKYGEMNEGFRPNMFQYNLFVLEWNSQTSKLVKRLQKHWDTNKRDLRRYVIAEDYFTAWEAVDLVSLPTDKREIVETVPRFLAVEWRGSEYILYEQQHPQFVEGVAWGSRVFSWLSANCYRGLEYDHYPRECLIGIRDFFKDGKLRIVTMWTDMLDKESIPRKYKFLLRVRKWEPGFQVEWEQERGREVVPWLEDPLNPRAGDGLIVHETGTIAEMKRLEKYPVFIIEPEPDKHSYRLRPIEYDKKDLPKTKRGWYPAYRVGRTRDANLSETWGYSREDAKDGLYSFFPQRTVLRPDLTGWSWDNLVFPHHEKYLGVGFYNLADLDGDGLDEVILVEETGDRKLISEDRGTIRYTNTKDYLRILKWNGKEYETMWVSPPYTTRGTKFLVDDIKGDGKKQLVVFNAYGTVEVWEKK